MPLYEYFCEACQQKFELLQKISDEAASSCALCQKGPVSKLISKAAFILKGTGWYETDFKGKKPNTSEVANPQTNSTSTTAAAAESSSSTSTTSTKADSAATAPAPTSKKNPD